MRSCPKEKAAAQGTWQKQGSYTNYTRTRFMYQTHFGSPLSQKGAALRYISIVNPAVSQKRATDLILKKKQGLVQEERENKAVLRLAAKEKAQQQRLSKDAAKYQEYTKKKLFKQSESSLQQDS